MELEKGTPIFAVCEFGKTCEIDPNICPGKFFFNREEEGLSVGHRLKYVAEYCPHSQEGVFLTITHVDDEFIKFVHRRNLLHEKRYEKPKEA